MSSGQDPGRVGGTGEVIVSRSTPVFPGLVDLASARLGGRAIEASDEFFAGKENLLRPEPAVFRPGLYTRTGKWMDGWESRRAAGRASAGGERHDWCIVRLGIPGRLRAIEIDTSFFVGNYPPYAAVDARAGGDAGAGDGGGWVEIVERSPLLPDKGNLFPLEMPFHADELRLRIYPDGGVARLRAWGDPAPVPHRQASGESALVDGASLCSGGRVIASSDHFFGEPECLLRPDSALNMGDGWETRRRRGPGWDWLVVRLGAPMQVEKLIIDTRHFIGNHPEACEVEGCRVGERGMDLFDCTDHPWRPLIGRTPLGPDRVHELEELVPIGAIDHVRLSIHPDGGVSRFRVLGHVEASPDAAADASRQVAELDALPAEALVEPLHDCCGIDRFVDLMLETRPWADEQGLRRAAESVFDRFRATDWIAAFDAHPRIGELDALRQRFGNRSGGWSEGEQASVGGADESVLRGLIEGNEAYEERFGHRFVICATDKGAAFMLGELRRRLGRSPGLEIDTGSREQRKITALRIGKWLRAVDGPRRTGS